MKFNFPLITFLKEAVINIYPHTAVLRIPIPYDLKIDKSSCISFKQYEDTLVIVCRRSPEKEYSKKSADLE